MIRPTEPGALLLFIVEPQQLDAVHEYGTEILSPDSIRAGASCCDHHAGWADAPACDDGESDGLFEYACPTCETDEHTADEHDSLAALDEDTDRYEDT
jgi:hypothetical protein